MRHADERLLLQIAHSFERSHPRARRPRAGFSLCVTLHDPTLAARFADRALLLLGDGRWSLGPVSSALTAQTLSELYLTPMLELAQDGRRVFVTA